VALTALLGLVSFHAISQTVIPDGNALATSAADTSKPGFIWRIHQTTAGYPTTIARAESQLAGFLGVNVADTTVQGPATDVATAPVPGTAPIEFLIPTVINVDQGGGSSGNFTPDEQMPGVGASGTDNIAVEVLTWLELPVGEVIMGVNSDDGFRVTIGGANPKDLFATKVGEFDAGRGAGDSIFRFNISKAGLYAARLLYFEGGGDARVEWFTQTADGTKILINDPTGGVKAYRAITGGAANASLSKVSPGINQTGLAPNASLDLELTEGATSIDASSVKISIDGTEVAANTTKAGKVITSKFSPAALYLPGSTHTILYAYVEAGAPKSVTYNFTVASYGTLKTSDKVNADTSKPGFLWNVFANGGVTTTSNQRAEDALAGLLKDLDGNLLPNNADPAAKGVALSVAAAANPANAPLRFEIPGVINLTQDAADEADNKNGNFIPDLQMPGIPATDGTEGIAAEIVTYVELPAGVITMGVNSDDGFRTTGGNPLDIFQAIQLGEFDGARGAVDTIFSIVVEEPGVYAFRTIWEEGTGGANIEWFTVKADGTKVLINDIANGGFKAYRALAGGTNPYFKSVNPIPVLRQVNQPSTQITLVLADGSNAVDDNTVTFTLDGAVVVPVKSRSGRSLTVTHQPTVLSTPGEVHTAVASFKTVGGAYTRSQAWSFMNLRNIVLPAPLVTENFDSYTEGGIPTGWLETNFTTTGEPGLDLDNLNSDSYKGWVVVSGERLNGLKSRIFNVAPGQTLNGQEVTLETLTSGNLLYAESDVRGGNQVQFIKSNPFNLSAITNVVFSFGSLYEQNQDSLGAVEYSINGGSSWLPVVYFLDIASSGGDIKLRSDGTVDAVLTLNSPNADTAAWTENGVAKGDNYGDGIAAPITSALDRYIVPRINDDATIDKRLEVFRLPQAGLKADVRLRFAQLGTGSWYFGVDNLAFYDVAPTTVVAPVQARFEVSTRQDGKVRVAWTGTGTLEWSDTVPGAWTTAPDQSNPQLVIPGSEAKFYRIRQ